METLLILSVLAYIVVRAQRHQGSFERSLTQGLRGQGSKSTLVLIAGGLVLLALFIAIEPETRVLLMFLDSVGVDLFVTVCILYLRHNLVLVIAVLLVPVLKGMYRWGPVPGFWPSRYVMRSSATWAGYAIVVPVVTLCGAALAALCLSAVLSCVVKLVLLNS